MEFFKLNSSYKPSTTVNLKDTDTLIWTERFSTEGDFKLVMEDDISILTTLPKGSLISHTDTRQVMIVENHLVERDDEKKLKTTITGRSFEIVADQRATLGSAQPLYDGAGDSIVESYTGTPEAVATLILTSGLEPGTASADDAIPNLDVTSVIRDPDVSGERIIQRGQLLPAVRGLLNISKAGLKTIRPLGSETTLKLVVHDGLDRTASVIFYASNEDLEDPQYFSSITNYKNYAQIAAHDHARLYRHKDVATTQSGLNRRVLYVDANDIEGAFGSPTNTDVVATRGQAELDEHKEISLMSAKISINAKPKFKLNYDIGDLVKVFGEWNVVQTMRVTEHILTLDKTGIRGYPSLTIE